MTKYSGQFSDDLEEVIESFETFFDVCDITNEKQKLKVVKIMLEGSLFSRYFKLKERLESYNEAIEALQEWY